MKQESSSKWQCQKGKLMSVPRYTQELHFYITDSVAWIWCHSLIIHSVLAAYSKCTWQNCWKRLIVCKELNMVQKVMLLTVQLEEHPPEVQTWSEEPLSAASPQQQRESRLQKGRTKHHGQKIWQCFRCTVFSKSINDILTTT